MIGMILGNRYELSEVIGEGGMSVVYKAKDTKLNRWVAVKILKKEFADNEEIATKFRKEATAIANLADMNIVNVIDVGHEEEDNIDYFVMEFVDGKTLKDIIVFNGRLGYNTAITLAIQIAKALDCAHRNNIIHRDIKPQNILVTEHGDVKVTDFGIAKSSTSSTITNTTTIMGSAHYLSPEQAKGTFIDIRTDIYSLGIVLFEMVTGKLPFQGESPVTIALKHIQEQPVEPKTLNPTIPESLNSLILKAISKEPLNRYQTTKELIADLQRIKENPDVAINSKVIEDDSKTIVMAPVNVPDNIKQSKATKVNKSEFYDDDYEEDDEDEDDDYEEKKPKKKKKSNAGKIVASIFVAIILLGIGFFALTTINKVNKDVTVPEIAGKNVDAAKADLEALGLKIEVIGTLVSDQPENNVLQSNPAAGTVVKKDTVIKVTISGGEEKIKMPDLREYEINYIKQVLDQLGLTNYTVQEQFDDKVESGILISQQPEKGKEVTKDTEITLVISKGPEVKLVKVENYVGFKVDDAKSKLESLKLVPEVMEQATDRESENGIVLSQSNQGDTVTEGTKVNLYVGKYEEPKIDVTQYISVGMNLADAIKALTAQGIQYTIDGGNPPDKEQSIYEVTKFTESIKKGEAVKLEVKKLESAPADGNNTNPNTNTNNHTNP